MFIISREFVEQSGDDPRNLILVGQVNDVSAWSIRKLNMLLHGETSADIRIEDTLLHPMHREGGELERFDRVIANPLFSQILRSPRKSREISQCINGFQPSLDPVLQILHGRRIQPQRVESQALVQHEHLP